MITYAGASVRQAVKEVLDKEKPGGLLLVRGRHSFESSGAAGQLNEVLSDFPCQTVRVPEAEVDLTFLQQQLPLLDFKAVQLILAVGGGSVMDLAKLLAFFMPQPHALHEPPESWKQHQPLLPLLAVPTTAGSGSEATHFAVLYRGHEKLSVASPALLPAYVVLDPSLTYALSPALTASSGMDALCQAMESLWARAATPDSRRHAMKALRLLYPAIIDAVRAPGPEVRKKMQMGAHYAGKAINESKTTAPHALSYALTKQYGLPHGEAVAINMELFIDINYASLSEDIRSYFDAVFGVQGKEQLMAAFAETKRVLGLKAALSELGMGKEALRTYFLQVNRERLSNNPVVMEPGALYKYYLSWSDSHS